MEIGILVVVLIYGNALKITKMAEFIPQKIEDHLN